MTALAMIGSLVSTVGSVMGLQQQAAIAKANAQQNRLNAINANITAQKDTQDIGEQGRGDLGTLNANQGASGLAISSPSFGRGVGGFLSRVYGTEQRRQSEGNQQTAAYNTQANVEDFNAKSATSAIPFAIAGGVLGAMQGNPSLFSKASPTSASYLPSTPQLPQTFLASNTVPRPRLRPQPAWAVY